MQTFKVRVACDLYGSKHNAMFLFKPPPANLEEVITEAQRFYQEEAEGRKPVEHPGPAFKIVALQVYNQASNKWEDVTSVGQLTDGCQLYAFQQQTSYHHDSFGAIPDAMVGESMVPEKPRPIAPVTTDGTVEQQVFEMLDTRKDGIITLDEMVEAFHGLHLRFTPAQIQDLFTVADENRDNVISWDEYERFALRFPTIVDSIFQKKIDEEVQQRGQSVLKDAEAALQAEQEIERKLLEDAACASKRVRELMGQIAEHKLNHETALQRKPVVEAQQQQLIEQELALAAQKERLKQAQEDIRRDIEEQLLNVSTSIGGITRRESPAQQEAPQYVPAQDDDYRHVSASSNTSSFFLPSESPKGAPQQQHQLQQLQHHQTQVQHHGHSLPLWDDSLPPTPATKPKLPVGTEVEACNFETKPEFNGLRGKVVAIRDDGKVAVEFVIRGGLTLDMLPTNVRAVGGPTNPPIGADIETMGPAKGTATSGPVDLRGQTGKVVGFRNGMLLCEFPPRAGLFEIRPQHVVPVSQPYDQARQQPPQMASELEKARREAEGLRRELEVERAKSRSQGPQSPNPEVQAALERLGNLSVSPQHARGITTLPSSPLRMNPPAAVPLNLASSALKTDAVWSSNPRHLSPARSLVC
eukprot:TRINITY_DN1643_c1_g3_i2.p1 TRINITY_DN1643_c1_g3~~TRINITY_DN1643_c1_g3_i2.p1  ORF type:complete len:640 (+),score=186.33 TRINITY_DN1643_c1_g3_i2:1298-3217(+)